MTQEFSPDDFEPIHQQLFVLINAITENSDSSLIVLLDDLSTVQEHLSTLIAKASNPNSLLRKRCGDRHGEWLQLKYDLQHALCEAHDLVDSLAKSDVLEIVNDGTGLKEVGDGLSLSAFLLGQFIGSLGLSKLGRKEPALGEIERFLIDAVREQREKLGREKLANMPEVNRLGGWHRICRLLETNGLERLEIERLDTKIKQLLIWVYKNEEEITMVNDMEGFGEVGKDIYGIGAAGSLTEQQESKQQVEPTLEKQNARRPMRAEVSEIAQEAHSEPQSEDFEEVRLVEHEELTHHRDGTDDLVHIARSEGNDTESLDSYVFV